MIIEGLESGSASIPLTRDPDPDQGGPKTYGSDGSGSATLVNSTLEGRRDQ